MGAEIPALAAIVTFLFQFIKQHPKFDQDRFWHIGLIVLSIIVGFVIWHNITQAIQACGLIAMQAMANYHTWQLTGMGGLEPYKKS